MFFSAADLRGGCTIAGHIQGGHQRSHRTNRHVEPPALAELAKVLTPVTRPKQLTLMRCTPLAEPFDDSDWIFAPKLDGLRVFCWIDGRRLAIHVEDHPLAYADFSGEIPEVQYRTGITKGHILVPWEVRGDDVEARD